MTTADTDSEKNYYTTVGSVHGYNYILCSQNTMTWMTAASGFMVHATRHK